jgi:hypothetical protein
MVRVKLRSAWLMITRKDIGRGCIELLSVGMRLIEIGLGNLENLGLAILNIEPIVLI